MESKNTQIDWKKLFSVINALVLILQCMILYRQTTIMERQTLLPERQESRATIAQWSQLKTAINEIFNLYPHPSLHNVDGIEEFSIQQKIEWANKILIILNTQTQNQYLIDNPEIFRHWLSAIDRIKLAKNLLSDPYYALDPDPIIKTRATYVNMAAMEQVFVDQTINMNEDIIFILDKVSSKFSASKQE